MMLTQKKGTSANCSCGSRERLKKPKTRIVTMRMLRNTVFRTENRPMLRAMIHSLR